MWGCPLWSRKLWGQSFHSTLQLSKKRARPHHFGHAWNENTWREQQINLPHEAYFFSFSSKSPSDPRVMSFYKEKRPWKHARLPARRDSSAYVVSVLRPTLTFNGLQIMTVVFGCFQMRFQQISAVWFICIHCFKSLFFSSVNKNRDEIICL